MGLEALGAILLTRQSTPVGVRYMAVKDSQIRQVIIEFLKRPDSNSKHSITFRHNRNEGVLDLCRAKIPGFDKGDEERVYELF